MKDYRVKKDKRKPSDYILSVTTAPVKGEDGKKVNTMQIKFADGRVFKDIEYDVSNVQKLMDIQEQQAREGVKAIDEFVQLRAKAGAITFISSMFGFAGSAVATTTMQLPDNEPLVATIGIGIITILSAIPGLCSLVRNHGIVRELEKIEYRDQHIYQLAEAMKYPNALEGLSKKQKQWLKEAYENKEEPFHVFNIDEYSIDDMETIVANVETEKALQLKYTPHQAAPTKK